MSAKTVIETARGELGKVEYPPGQQRTVAKQAEVKALPERYRVPEGTEAKDAERDAHD